MKYVYYNKTNELPLVLLIAAKVAFYTLAEGEDAKNVSCCGYPTNCQADRVAAWLCDNYCVCACYLRGG